jgi:LacI family transcriptional regulator, repressor for deo operon, udp, cdd, tsx, nupC, and nupG
MKKVNIKDVASKAKVSVATVSRTLNDPESVKESTRKEVMKAVEALDYDPNPIAIALRSNKVKSIGIIIPNITNTSMAEITRGAHEELVSNGNNTVLYNSAEDFRREEYYCEILQNAMVDGVIFVTGTGATPPVEKLASNVAVCLINRETELKQVDQVMADEKEGMRLLCYHFYHLGHKKIAFITGNQNTTATKNKIESYESFFKNYKLEYNKDYIISGHWTIKGAYMAMKELLGQKNIPTAVIVGTDTMSLGALSAIKDSGLKVPEDIVISGFDNSPNSEFYDPPLTTLRYPNYELGKLAARSILYRLKNPDSDKRVITLSLDILIRKSCGYRIGFDNIYKNYI